MFNIAHGTASAGRAHAKVKLLNFGAVVEGLGRAVEYDTSTF
jgi:hypothetical protein